MSDRTALSALAKRPLSLLASAWPWRSLAYLLASSALGAVVALVVLVAVVETPVPGVLALAVAVVLATGFTWLVATPFELWRLRLVDLDLARDTRLAPRREAGASPRELGYVLVSLLALWWMDIGVVAVSLGVPGVLLTAPLQPTVSAVHGVVASVVGLLLLPVAAYPVTAWAGARAVVARAILAPPNSELGEVVRSRARLVDAFEAERRRIERDLHDGAQQHLVALSMKLGLAGLDAPPDSSLAEDLRDAHVLVNLALAELRELIRGVYPQVLTDRGLVAAIRDVAGRSPVPVVVDVVLEERLSDTIEVAVYYVVSEALTNVAKHSGATRCAVRGGRTTDLLVIEVVDDGVGGAGIDGGSGLQGLADRLAVVAGTLSISSPPGGPTLLRVEVPCRKTDRCG
ncbi:sensor histidine kinase [Actinokineospora sp. G85]|uniref:sensor histidine kinase n=1 Tax=Actinokineospora sp. G85 TaxID=3406626 RepID=UPI003C769637